MSTPLLLTRREAAKLLGIGPLAVNTLLQRGDIAQVQIGRQMRITRASCEAFASMPVERKTDDQLIREWRTSV